MSAIAGLLSLDSEPVEAEPAERMAESLAWRGRDDDGRYRSPDGRLAMAARRLGAGDALLPMSNETHDVWMAADGEILNHRALRHSLELAGHRFRSRSDAEVALHAYEQWGLDFASHLQGAFAIALWDDRHDRLVLLRDALGRKPLYFARHRMRLAFASGVAPVLDVLGLTRRIDPAALDDYLALGCIPSPRSIAAGVSKLGPGDMLVAERDCPPRLLHWGDPLPDERRAHLVRALPFDRHAGNLRTLIECAVADRVAGDTPVCVLLDGTAAGALAAIAGRLTGRPTSAVAVVDAGAPDGEAAQDARLLAASARADLDEIRVRAEDAAAAIEPLAAALPEPIADPHALAGWFAAVSAGEGRHAALLSADGADEVLLCHPAYRGARRSLVADRLCRLLPLLRRLRRRGDAPAGDAPLPSALRPFGGEDWRGISISEGRAGIRPTPPQPPEWTEGDELEALGLRDLRWRIADGLVLRADAAAQAHGLETRLPFLDAQFLAYTLSVPGTLRSPAGSPRAILRRAVGDLFPPGLATRPRTAPPLPLDSWMAGALGTRLADSMGTLRLVRPNAVRTLLARHRAQGGGTDALWAVSMLVEWARAHRFDDLGPADEDARQLMAHSRS